MKSDIPELQVILERIEKLEVQNRRLRRGSVLILALLSAVIFAKIIASESVLLDCFRHPSCNVSRNGR